MCTPNIHGDGTTTLQPPRVSNISVTGFTYRRKLSLRRIKSRFVRRGQRKLVDVRARTGRLVVTVTTTGGVRRQRMPQVDSVLNTVLAVGPRGSEVGQGSVFSWAWWVNGVCVAFDSMALAKCTRSAVLCMGYDVYALRSV